VSAVEAPTAQLATPGIWAVVVLVLAALGVRAGALWIGRDAEAWNDQVTYVQRAEDLLDGKGYTGSYQSWVRHKGERQLSTLPRYLGAYQAPGYPAFLALVMKVAGRDVVWVKLVQVLLGAATAWFVYAIGRDSVSHAAGLCAGWLYALDPTFVAFTHFVFTETLFVFLFTAALWLWMRGGALSIGRAVVAGALFAAAAYVKSSVVYLLPLLALWLLWRERVRVGEALRFSLVAGVAWAACIAPWTARNYEVHGGLVLIDSSGPFNLWRGHNPGAYKRRANNADWNVRFAPPFEVFSIAPVSEAGGSAVVELARERFETEQPTDLQVMQAAQASALEFAREDLGWTARRAWYKVVDLWNPTSFLMRHLHKGGYGELAPWVAQALTWACVLSYVFVWAAAAPALWRYRRTALGGMVLLLVYYYTFVHAATFGLTRFRLPVMPMVMVLAGATLAGWWGRRATARTQS
jgi:4-amino-4-deoxy-L-arabinose transferase-like glycosyltransferase